MGYNGKTEKNRRFKGVVVDETYRMLQTGLEMIDIIKEIRESYNDPQYDNLDVRVGIHTGKVVAGIIGSRIVRYDILGEGVLITNKVQINGIPGKVCISEDTRKLLMANPEIANEFYITEHEMVNIPSINRKMMTYQITLKDTISYEESDIGSQFEGESSEEESESGEKHA
jgi:class 3 adenylate cyclase